MIKSNELGYAEHKVVSEFISPTRHERASEVHQGDPVRPLNVTAINTADRRPDVQLFELNTMAILEEYLGDMDFTIEPIGSGKYIYRETKHNAEGVVSSVEELIEKAHAIADGLSFETHELELVEYDISAENAMEVMQEIRDTFRNKVAKLAEKAWEAVVDEDDL